MATEQLEEDEGPDEIMRVFERDGGAAACEAGADERLVRNAVRAWMEEKQDVLLDLTLVGGGLYTVLASQVTSWTVTTRAQRRRDSEISVILQRQANVEGWTPDS